MNIPPKQQGAVFRKCDFQVHTLRDLSFKGPFDPLAHREKFAAALIGFCRDKGINAIAITDHHDLCLWRLVRDAAAQEALADGTPAPIDDRIIVFPGVELTLSTPAHQAILIFDPDLSVNVLAYIWGVLGVVPTDESHPSTANTEPLAPEKTIRHIFESLSRIRTNPEETNPANYQFLAGRFILLPNVKPGGYKTLLRKGNHLAYRESPFVGGYIEGGFYKDIGPGDKKILEGEVDAYGRKAIGVFQTSDCRSAIAAAGGKTEFVDLGKWPTWVKWAEPSAEALRQACLARRSRIMYAEPELPVSQIVGVRVTDSLFLGPVELGLNAQFNAFIGSRGTGKSSLLEYIRWALCDDPIESSETAELPNFQKRRKALIENTLKPHAATVEVYYKKNEVVYCIQRSAAAKDGKVMVSAPDGTTKYVIADQLREEFPIVSYSQKQLSSVGTLPDEINRLITDPIRVEIAKINEEIDQVILPQLVSQRRKELRVLELKATIERHESAAAAARLQIQALQAQLHEVSAEQTAVIGAHAPMVAQADWLSRAEDHVKKIAELLESASAQVSALGAIAPPVDLPNYPSVLQVVVDANSYRTRVLTQIESLLHEQNQGIWLSAASRSSRDQLISAFGVHTGLYNAAVSATAKNQRQITQIAALNTELTEHERALSEAQLERTTIQAQLDLTNGLAWKALMRALRRRARCFMRQCRTVASQAGGEFRPLLRFCADRQQITAVLKRVVDGRNIRDGDEKVYALATQVVESRHPVKKWQEVVGELESVINSRGSGILPKVICLADAGFTVTNLEAIRNNVSAQEIDAFRFLNLQDQIDFEFRMKGSDAVPDRYIPFNDASPGQQATCLLRTLLAQAGPPLLIDQPEEDLDNEQIHDLSERLVSTKHNRQLIFVSHNANIVVNGDAELVACFDYRDPLDNTRGRVGKTGSIDCEHIRQAITSVMEGGRLAFEMRKTKYGF